MNAQQLFLIAVIVGAVGVYGRKLNTLENFFDSGVLSSFQSSLPPIYAFPASATTGLTTAVGDFAEGAFAQFTGASNSAGDDASVFGSSSLTSTSDDTSSTVAFSADTTASSNGPGESFISNIGTGTAEFVGGGSIANFDFSSFNSQTSDTNAVANSLIDAFATSSDGFSQSGTSICAGTNC